MLRPVVLIGLIGFLFDLKWIEGELSTCFIKIAWCCFLWMLVSLLLTSPFITSHNLVKAFTHGDVTHMLCVNNRTKVNVQLFYFSLPPPHLLVLACVHVNGSLAKNQPERLRWGKWSVTPTCWTITYKTFFPPDFCPICTTAGEIDYFLFLIKEFDIPEVWLTTMCSLI